MFDPVIEALCRRIGWILIHFVWQGLSVALVLAAVLALLKRATARLRYGTGCVALMVMMVLPVVTFCHLDASPKAPSPINETSASLDGVLAAPSRALSVPALEAIDTDPEVPPSVSIQQADIPREPRFDLVLEQSLPYVSLLWLTGVTALCAWHMGGWLTLQRFKRRVTRDIDASILAVFDRLTQQMRMGRAVSLYESSRVYVPTVIGWLKPVILLPVSAMSGLSTEQIASILAHELAHIKRQDYLVNILQTFLEILGFYHPAVWWVSGQIRIEREHCCDDLAVAVCGDSMAYARALTQLETARSQDSVLAMTATGGSLTHRIKRLVLTPSANQSAPAWVSGLVLALVLVAMACPAVIAWGQSRATSRPDDPNDQDSKAWTVMRQFNSPRLLQGLMPQFARVLDPNRSDDTVWQNVDAGGTLDLLLDVEDDRPSNIVVGLFQEPTWASEPVAMRRVQKSGRVRLTGLPLGEYQIAAMLAGPELPRALGVQKQWPRPVTIGQGLDTSVHVFVSRDFLREASGYENDQDSSDLLGQSGDMDQAHVLRGRLTGPDGQPVQFGKVFVREHRPASESVVVSSFGINALGFYQHDGMDKPYRVSAQLYESVPSVFGDRTQQIVFNQVLEGSQAVDFRFGPFPTGTASLKGKVMDQANEPVQGFFVEIGSGNQAGHRQIAQNPDGSHHETFSLRVPFVSEDGTFELNGLPEGKVTVDLTPFDMRRYQMLVGKDAELGHGESSSVVLELKSKQIYYGRVLFDDGSPAFLSPAEHPLTGRDSKISIYMAGSHSVSLGEADRNGNFKIHLDESTFEQLKSHGTPLDICVSGTRRRRTVGLGVYPFERLSKERATAGQVRIFNPHRPFTREDILRVLRDQAARINDLFLEFEEEQIVRRRGGGIIGHKRHRVTLRAKDRLFRIRKQEIDPVTQGIIFDQEYAEDGATAYSLDRTAGNGTFHAARPEQGAVRQEWAKYYLRNVQMKGNPDYQGALRGALEAASQDITVNQGMIKRRRQVFLSHSGHARIQLDPDMNFAVSKISIDGEESSLFKGTNSDFVEVIEGIWMPLKTENILRQGETTTGITTKVNRIEFNNGYTVNDFRIDFEPDIRARDLDLDVADRASITTDAKMSSGPASQSLEANVLAQKIKASIEPQSWYKAGGEGTCTVYNGTKLALLQTKEIHAEIELYLQDIRKHGGASEYAFESSVLTRPKLETRIFDISDLVTGPAGSQEQSLEANVLAQKIKTDIEPQSWFQAEGEGTCTVFGGVKLVMLQTRAIHRQIELYLQTMRIMKRPEGARELPMHSTVLTKPKLLVRIYDISDLVTGQVGSKEQSLEANMLTQNTKTLPVQSTLSPVMSVAKLETDSRPTRDHQSHKISFTGRVVDSAGEPVVGASAVAYEMSTAFPGNLILKQVGLEITTSSSGRFVITAQDRSDEKQVFNGIILVSKEGLSLDWLSWNMKTNLTATFTLGEATAVKGVVLNPDGMPVSGAMVLANLTGAGPDQGWLSGLAKPDWLRVQTNQEGEFSFNHLPKDTPVNFLIRAQGLGTTYTDRSTTGDAAYQTGQQDIQIALPHEGRILGTLLDPDTQTPLSGVRIGLSPHSSSNMLYRVSDTTDDQGEFSFEGLRPGEYSLLGKEISRTSLIATSDQTTECILHGKRVRHGRVTFEDGSPAILSPSPWEGAKTQVRLTVADEPINEYDRSGVDLDNDGYFRVSLGDDEWQDLQAGERRRLRVAFPAAEDHKMLRGTIFPFELLSKDRATAGALKVSRHIPIKLEPRIYDISDLVAGPAGSKEQSLEANFLAQRIKAEIDPQSWYQADGEGTCTVYGGSRLAVLQIRAAHIKIGMYLDATRQYGGFQDESLLPDGWALQYKAWDQNDLDRLAGSSASGAYLWAETFTGQTRQEEACTLRITTFSGEPELSISSRDNVETGTILSNAKYLVFYGRSWGKHPDNGSTRSGPFLLNLSKPGKYQLSPTRRLGTGQITGTHEGCYAVNFQSIDRFPVTAGFVYQSPPGEYQINGLASGYYALNAVTQHDGDNVFVRRAQVQVASGESMRVDLPELEIGNCAIRGTIHGIPTRSVDEGDNGSRYNWSVLIRRANARPVTTCGAYESLTMDTDYVIRGRNIVQETAEQAQFKATGLLPGTYTVTAIERRPLQGFEVQRQQSKALVIKDGESATLDFDL